MKIPFWKMHGNGNDFIVINESSKKLIEEGKKPSFVRKACRRRFGIGGDGVIFLHPPRSPDTHVRMQYFNADGSEGEMCGNGIRCLAKYAIEKNIVDEPFLKVETKAGVRKVDILETEKFWARVDMGIPTFKKETIPAKGSGTLLEEKIGGITISACNTGVPHAVHFTTSLSNLQVEDLGKQIMTHPVFPEQTNVNFATRKNTDTLQVRTFERGVEEETLCCGTGAVAAAAVARKIGKMKAQKIHVNMKGGPLNILFEKKHAFMEGPAESVYEGTISHDINRK